MPVGGRRRDFLCALNSLFRKLDCVWLHEHVRVAFWPPFDKSQKIFLFSSVLSSIFKNKKEQVFVDVYICAWVCALCVCVCVSEREKEREKVS